MFFMKGKTAYERQQLLEMCAVVFEVPSFIAIVISAVMSNTILVWMEFMYSLTIILRSSIVVILVKKIKKDLRYEYNYGVEKLELSVSIVCNIIILIGLSVIGGISITELRHPKSPGEFLFYVIFLKIIQIVVDLIGVYFQTGITRENPNAITRGALVVVKKDLMIDIALFFSILICWLLRNNRVGWYFSPVVCLIIVIFWCGECIKLIMTSIIELADKTLPEEEQMEIIKMLAAYHAEYEEFICVKSRQAGNVKHIDLYLKFKKDTTYEQIESLRSSMEQEMQIENGVVSIVISKTK